MLTRTIVVSVGVMWFGAVTQAAPRARVVADPVADTGTVCSTGEIRCYAHVRITQAGVIRPFAGPSGYGPQDLWSAYQLDPNITTTPTVALVDAYGYANLEADLAQYRATYGLPPCTRASGCLTIVNQQGQTSPLPADPPPSDDWTLETALDVDMVSAMCPLCKILVVQANDASGNSLFNAELVAAAAKPTVISNSWGMATQNGQDLSPYEPAFDHPGIGVFASSGDSGYDEGGKGATYPSTSAHVVSVGGTSLFPTSGGRGWAEQAWSSGGSSCSFSIAKPSYQTSSPCQFRAASDIAAVGDPQTGLAVFNAANGGWVVMGGTSASSPIVASLFASIGRGAVTAADIAKQPDALFDVTAGSNGACGNILCNAGPGWDGPTGYGTPSASALAGGGGGGGGGGGSGLQISIASPADGAMVSPGFAVAVKASAGTAALGLLIDGVAINEVAGAATSIATPASIPAGAHVVEVIAIDASNHQATAQVHITVLRPTGGGGDASSPPGGGCSIAAPPDAPLTVAAIGLSLVVAPRRRRRGHHLHRR